MPNRSAALALHSRETCHIRAWHQSSAQRPRPDQENMRGILNLLWLAIGLSWSTSFSPTARRWNGKWMLGVSSPTK